MPLFDFGCDCGECEKDILLKFTHTKEDFPTCSKCGTKMQKLYGKATAIFKGAGFHANDYRAPTRGY